MDETTSQNNNLNKFHPSTTYKIHTLKNVYDELHRKIDNIKKEIKSNIGLGSEEKDNLIHQVNSIKHLIVDLECDWSY